MFIPPTDDDRYYTHLLALLSVSAGLVGVCLTAVGLVSIIEELGNLELVIDDFLGLATLLFMTVIVLTFLGMRTGVSRVWRGYAPLLDIVFCLGLVVMAVASLLLTWSIL